MKEYLSKRGGRYLFNEDIHHLQELALSITEMFKDSGQNFVISGCKVSTPAIWGDGSIISISVSEGYVFLDNKIRKVNGFTHQIRNNGESVSVGIYARDVDGPEITYIDGNTDHQYKEYTAFVGVNYVPETDVPSILASRDGNNFEFPNLRTAFFAHYCLMNNGQSNRAEQIDVDHLRVRNDLYVDGNISVFGLSVENPATFEHNVYVYGNSTFRDIQCDNANITSTLDVSGNCIVSGELSVGRDVDFRKNVAVGMELSVHENADVGGHLKVMNGMTVTGSCSLSGNLSVTGNVTGSNIDAMAEEIESLGRRLDTIERDRNT